MAKKLTEAEKEERKKKLREDRLKKFADILKRLPVGISYVKPYVSKLSKSGKRGGKQIRGYCYKMVQSERKVKKRIPCSGKQIIGWKQYCDSTNPFFNKKKCDKAIERTKYYAYKDEMKRLSELSKSNLNNIW